VHRNTRLIIGYSAAAYGGAVCAIIATVVAVGWRVSSQQLPKPE